MRVKVREVREAIIELDPENYAEDDRTIERMLKAERDRTEEDTNYMDIIDADSVITFDFIGDA